MSLQHPYCPSNNPRAVGLCACGHALEEHPPPQPIIRRNLDLEVELIRKATRGFAEPSALIEHCQARALHLSGEYVDDPMTIAPGMERKRQMREELADFVNHALFLAQENPEEMGGELGHDLEILIRVAANLYRSPLLRED